MQNDLEFAQLNTGDTYNDLIYIGAGKVIVRLGNGDMTFKATHTLNATGFGNIQYIEAGDVNADGNIDIVGYQTAHLSLVPHFN